MNNEKKVRLDNELIDIFTNLPKSTNTAMSWLLLHKSMEESLNSKKNNMKFNLLDFVSDYSIDYHRKYDLKKELIRDFQKLKNRVEKEYVNKKGQKNIKTFYFFQETNINLETLDVEIKLNENIYNSVSSIPSKNYFQYLKQEAILIVNKKMTPIDLKLLMYLKSKSHNAKVSYVKIYKDELYSILGQSTGTRFAVIKNRHIDPFIERAWENTNYRISYEIQKNKLNKRKIESILFKVDNRKEKINILSGLLEEKSPEMSEKGNKMFEEFEPEIKDMLDNEQRVLNNINANKDKKKEKLKQKQIRELELEEEKRKLEETRKLSKEETNNLFDGFDFDI